MSAGTNDTIAQLRKALLLLEGYKQAKAGEIDALTQALGPVASAFPCGSFPVGVIHEFITAGTTDIAATNGFVAGLLGYLMQTQGAVIWIGAKRKLYLPALTSFGVKPEQILFIDASQEKDLLWVTEEALKCEGLAAVIAEVKDLSFTASRRLQLAVEDSRVTGFLLRHQSKTNIATACVARWKVTALPGSTIDQLPGIGFARWHVQLLKVRNGKPGSWQVAWMADHFEPGVVPTSVTTSAPLFERKKAG